MYLPNRELAFVHEDKILLYLLNPDHERGKSKAAFFTRFGFTRENWQELALALIRLATEYEVVAVKQREAYGTIYIVDGFLVAPDGRKPFVRTAWVVDPGETIPRLSSAHPEKRRHR